MEEELFGKRIRPHDRYQFEMKLDYLFSKQKKRYRYRIEAYFFIPTSLDLRPENYSYQDFFKDVQNYIRFKTPTMSFEYLIDQEAENSPLFQIKRLLKELSKIYTKEKERAFIYETKLFACVFRSTFRENIYLLIEEVEKLRKSKNPTLLGEEFKKALNHFIQRYRAVLEKYRSLGQELLRSGFEELRASYQLIDEFLSLTVENYSYHLLEEISEIRHPGIRDSLFVIVRDIILDEEEYRSQKGYLSVIHPRDPTNELFLYRHGLIKKYCSNILYLDLSAKNIQKTWQHIFYAIAAGIAMFFATLLGFYAQRMFGNFSLSLLFAFVIIYMFKDRIKDIFRDIFKSWLNHWFYDRSVEIFDPSQKVKLGVFREKFFYLSFSALDRPIQELRKLNTLPALKIEERGETIFCYRRSIELYAQPVFRLHSRLSGLNDILRFNVKHMLTKMDEPFLQIPFVRRGSKEISYVSVAKIYHLNVIFRFVIDDREDAALYERLRIILDQRGIQRIERITKDGQVSQIH